MGSLQSCLPGPCAPRCPLGSHWESYIHGAPILVAVCAATSLPLSYPSSWVQALPSGLSPPNLIVFLLSKADFLFIFKEGTLDSNGTTFYSHRDPLPAALKQLLITILFAFIPNSVSQPRNLFRTQPPKAGMTLSSNPKWHFYRVVRLSAFLPVLSIRRTGTISALFTSVCLVSTWFLANTGYLVSCWLTESLEPQAIEATILHRQHSTSLTNVCTLDPLLSLLCAGNTFYSPLRHVCV